MFDRWQDAYRSRAVLVVGGIVMIAAACGSTSSYGSGSPAASRAPSAGVVARGGYGATVATSVSPPNTTVGSAASGGGGANVSIGHTSVGDILVDAQGLTLYAFTKDTNGASACTGTCATAWPPAVVSNTPTATSGVDGSKLTEITRPDGAKQLAYDGHPLYRYANDAKPGDVTGQKVSGVWFVIDGTGHLVGS